MSEGPVCEQLERRTVLAAAGESELLLNTYTTGEQQLQTSAAIAGNNSGAGVAVWASYNQDSLLSWGVYGQRLGPSGEPVGSEFLVNNVSLLNGQQRPAVAMNESGAFAVAWDGGGLLGLFPGIYVQRYDSNGNKIGAEIGVAGSLLLDVRNAAIAMDKDGGFIVAYEAVELLQGRGVFARRYAADGTPLTAAFGVNVTTSGNQMAPQVAVADDGSFVITWEGAGSGDASGVLARFYDPSGNPLTGEILINETTAGAQGGVSVASRPGGSYAFAWSGNGAGDSAGIFMRIFNNNGTASTGERLVNQHTADTQTQVDIAVDKHGDILVAWAGAGAADADGVYWREFDETLAPRQDEQLANLTTSGAQARPSAANIGDNTYLIAWEGSGVGDTSGAFRATVVNVAPEALWTVGNVSYTENDGWVTVGAGLDLSDADSKQLSSAVVTLGGGFNGSEDEVRIATPGTLSWDWDPTTGVLTLSGDADVSVYKTAIQSLQYRNTSEEPGATARTLTLVVSDGRDESAPTGRSVSVTAVNDPPEAVWPGGAATYNENAGWLSVGIGITIGDVDSAELWSATVPIGAGYESAEDSLRLTNAGSLSWNWDALSGTLTIVGQATLAAYEAALRSLEYRNASERPSSSDRVMSITVNDGDADSSEASRTVHVVPMNDAPVGLWNASTVTYTENDGWVVVDPLFAASDVDSDTLASATITIVDYVSGEDELRVTDDRGLVWTWNAIAGTLTISGTGSVADYQAAIRSVEYRNISDAPAAADRTLATVLSDGEDFSVEDLLTLTVQSVNDAPVAAWSGPSVSYTEDDGWITVDSATTLGDVDSSTLVQAHIRIVGHDPASGDELRVTDDRGLIWSWDNTTGVLTIAGAASIAEYQAALRSVEYRNTRQDLEDGTRTLELVVNDGVDDSSPVTRNIMLAAANDAPVGVWGAVHVDYIENDGWVVVDPLFAVSDVDSDTLTSATITIDDYVSGEDELRVTDDRGLVWTWSAIAGTLTISGTGSVADYQAAIQSVEYRNASDAPDATDRTLAIALNDGTDESTPDTLTLAVHPINDAPVAQWSGPSVSYTEDDGWVVVDNGISLSDLDSPAFEQVTIRILGYDPASGDELRVTDDRGLIWSWDNTTGILTLTGVASLAEYQAALRCVEYRNTRQDLVDGTRTLELVVSDGADDSSPVTRHILLDAVNDAPVAAWSGPSMSFTEGDDWVVIDSTATLSDVDSSTLEQIRIRILGYDAASDDELRVTDDRGLIWSWDHTTGVLTLTGVAFLADYQAALRSVEYRNTRQDLVDGIRTLELVVNDGVDDSSPVTRHILLSAVNDTPGVAWSVSGVSYAENAGWVTLDESIWLEDLDSPWLESATVRIASGYIAAEDELRFVNAPGLSWSWDHAEGVLTLTGTQPIAVYLAALRSIEYRNTSDAPSPQSRVLELTVSDGVDTSPGATLGLDVIGINDAPVVMWQGASAYVEDDGWIHVDAALALGDLDSAWLSGARIEFTSGFDPSTDTLRAATVGSIVWEWDGSAGILSLAGVASVSEYETALRSIQILIDGDRPSDADRVLTLTVWDEEGAWTTAGATLAVTPIDDEAVVIWSIATSAFVEDQGWMLLDPFLQLDDPDTDVADAAEVHLYGGFDPAADKLALSNPGALTWNWDPDTGRLRITGTASIDAYREALRSLAFRHTSDNPDAIDRVLVISIETGGVSVTSTPLVLAVMPVDDPLVLDLGDAMFVLESGTSSRVLAPLASLSDVDSDALAGLRLQLGPAARDVVGLYVSLVPSGLSVTWDVAEGELVIVGHASLSEYQGVLRSIYVSRVGPVAADLLSTLTVVAMQEDGPSASASLQLSVMSDPPLEEPEDDEGGDDPSEKPGETPDEESQAPHGDDDVEPSPSDDDAPVFGDDEGEGESPDDGAQQEGPSPDGETDPGEVGDDEQPASEVPDVNAIGDGDTPPAPGEDDGNHRVLGSDSGESDPPVPPPHDEGEAPETPPDPEPRMEPQPRHDVVETPAGASGSGRGGNPRTSDQPPASPPGTSGNEAPSMAGESGSTSQPAETGMVGAAGSVTEAAHASTSLGAGNAAPFSAGVMLVGPGLAAPLVAGNGLEAVAARLAELLGQPALKVVALSSSVAGLAGAAYASWLLIGGVGWRAAVSALDDMHGLDVVYVLEEWERTVSRGKTKRVWSQRGAAG